MVVGGRFNTPPPSVVDLAVPTCHFGSSCQCAAWTSGVGELLGCLVIFVSRPPLPILGGVFLGAGTLGYLCV